MLVHSCSQLTTNPIIKKLGEKIKTATISISVIEVMTLEIPDPSSIHKLNFSTFQLSKGVTPLDVMHCMDHKMSQTLKIPILNINNTISSLGKNLPVAALVPAEKCEQIQEVKWSGVTQEPDLLKKQQLMPEILSATNLHLEPNTPSVSKFIPDAYIPKRKLRSY